MRPDFIFCSQWLFTQWLQKYLIPCPFKKLTGFDCPGCGFQRSVLALLNGDMSSSIHLYPATLPVLLALGFSVLPKGRKHNFTHIQKALYFFAVAVILVSYLVKVRTYI